MQMKHPGLLTGRVIVPQNNDHSHTAGVRIKFLEQFHSECLAHPPYSPDIASNIYHIRPPKKNVEEKYFKCDNRLKIEVHQQLQTLSPDFFSVRMEQEMHN
jgi:transposase